MKNSLIVLIIFVSGVLIGISGKIPDGIISTDLSELILYALVVQIGISLGVSGNLIKIIRGVSVKSLLLPISTIVSSLFFTALVGLWLDGWSITDYLALGSGLGYYSISSVLLIDIKSGEIGLQAATQLGMLALLVNIIRELTALVGGPWFAKIFGKYAPTAAAGVTSMDVSLPMIVRCTGQQMFPIALMHGLILEVSVPLLVTLFAEL